MKEQLRQLISTVCGLPPEEIKNDIGPGDFEEWDSIKHVELIAAIEDEFKISFDFDEMDSLVNFNTILASLIAHANAE